MSQEKYNNYYAIIVAVGVVQIFSFGDQFCHSQAA